jgi:hypothetical protein
MLSNLINRTIVNYVLVAIGTFLVSKGWVPIEFWDIFRSGAEEAILIAAGGGGVVAIIIGAARGIAESKKDKVVINGQRVELPGNVSGTMTAKTAADCLVGRL